MKNESVYYFVSFLFFKTLYSFFILLEKISFLKLRNAIVYKIVSYFDDEIVTRREEFCPARKEIVVNVILALPSHGCQYYFQTGGCSMCGFNNEVKKYKLNIIHSSAIIFLTKIFITYLELENKVNTDYKVLSIFMAGSFFNQVELPRESQEIVLDFFLNSSFDKIFLESRAENILKDRDYIEGFNEKILSKSKVLEVSLGLESANDYIRNEIIKKGVSKSKYEKAVDFLVKEGVMASTYILVGNPYSSDEEIVKEFFNNIDYVWRAGVDIVNLEIYCVQDKTPWAELFRKGIFRPLPLQKLVEALKGLELREEKWRLGAFSDWPKPLAYPSSCKKCESKVLKAIENLRINHSFSELKKLEPCNCEKGDL